MDMDLFERAMWLKLRFESIVGDLTVEEVSDLPLMSQTPLCPDLDTLARGIDVNLRNLEGRSFVESEPDPYRDALTLKLDILKRIIEVKLAEREVAQKTERGIE